MHIVLLGSCGTDLCLRGNITVHLSCLSVIKVAFVQTEEFLPLSRDKNIMKRCKGAHVLQTARWRECQSVKIAWGGWKRGLKEIVAHVTLTEKGIDPIWSLEKESHVVEGGVNNLPAVLGNSNRHEGSKPNPDFLLPQPEPKVVTDREMWSLFSSEY